MENYLLVNMQCDKNRIWIVLVMDHNFVYVHQLAVVLYQFHESTLEVNWIALVMDHYSVYVYQLAVVDRKSVV